MKKLNLIYRLGILLSASLLTNNVAAQNCNASSIIKQTVLGETNFLIIRTNFVGGDVDENLNAERIDAYMEAVDGYMTRTSNGKAGVGSYEMTPVLESKLTSEDIKANLTLISQEMKKLATEAGYDVENKLVYLIFDSEVVQLSGGGAFGSGNGVSGQTWWPSNLPFSGGGFVHETMHMFGVGHLGLIIGDRTYPARVETNGLDPYHFMGSEGTLTRWDPNNPYESVGGTLPVSIKNRLGWIEDSNLIQEDKLTTTKHRIYVGDAQGYSDDRKIGIILKKPFNDKSFSISYNLNVEKSTRIVHGGVLVHEFRGDGLGFSETFLLDAHPDSVDGIPEGFRKKGVLLEMLHELADAALLKGDEINVADKFTIKLVDEGGTGNDRWADIEIAPFAGCDLLATHINSEDFDYNELDSGTPCKDPGFDDIWNVDPSQLDQIELSPSLTYNSLSTVGKSITLTGDPNESSLEISSTLSNVYCGDGEVLWVSYLLRADKVANGHIFVYPNTNIDAGLGKNFGRRFAIHNNSQSVKSLSNGQTFLVVGKYVLNDGKDDVYLWIDPDTNVEPKENEALVKRIGEFEIGNTVSSMTINLSGNDSGVYTLDRIRNNRDYIKMFEDDNPTNVTLSNTKFDVDNTISNRSVTVFPNPTADKLTISNIEIGDDLTIYNILGENILSLKAKNSTQTINTSTLSSGLYMIYSSGKYLEKFVKNN